MGINSIPELSGSIKAAVELGQVQEDLRLIAGGNLSPDTTAFLFNDAQSRLQALQKDKGIPQEIKEAIAGLLKDLARGSVADVEDAMKTIARLEPNTNPIVPDGDMKPPVYPEPLPDSFPYHRFDPGSTEKPHVGPGGTQPIVGPGGTEDPRVGPGGLPPKR